MAEANETVGPVTSQPTPAAPDQAPNQGPPEAVEMTEEEKVAQAAQHPPAAPVAPPPTGIAPPEARPKSKVYTDFNEIKKDAFPDSLKCEPSKYISQTKDLEVRVPPHPYPLGTAYLHKDIKGVTKPITQVDFGSYTIKFKGNEYTANTVMEKKILDKMPKVICLD